MLFFVVTLAPYNLESVTCGSSNATTFVGRAVQRDVGVPPIQGTTERPFITKRIMLL